MNIGAGSGSYEPTDLAVVSIEPCELMIRQRPPSLPPAVPGVDVALAVLTAHHWPDRPAAFAGIRRVARGRAVFFTHDPDASFGWLDDYFPGLAGDTCSRYPRLAEFEVLGRVTVEPVPVPADCTDGFTAAYWRRPSAYLSEAVRANMSTFALLDEAVVTDGVARLARDLADRSWHSRYAFGACARECCRGKLAMNCAAGDGARVAERERFINTGRGYREIAAGDSRRDRVTAMLRISVLAVLLELH